MCNGRAALGPQMDILFSDVVFLLPRYSCNSMYVHHCYKCMHFSFSHPIQETQWKSNHYWKTKSEARVAFLKHSPNLCAEPLALPNPQAPVHLYPHVHACTHICVSRYTFANKARIQPHQCIRAFVYGHTWAAALQIAD